MLLRECHVRFCIGYVNTRPIDCKLKSQPYRSTQGKQSVLMIKDKQTIFSLLEKGENGTNVALKLKNRQAEELIYTQ